MHIVPKISSSVITSTRNQTYDLNSDITCRTSNTSPITIKLISIQKIVILTSQINAHETFDYNLPEWHNKTIDEYQYLTEPKYYTIK